MKKLLLILIIPVVLFFTCIKKDNELRVRVISNSNLEEDVIIKNKIKEELITYLDDIKNDSYEEMVSYLTNNLNTINTNLNKIVDCNVSLENHNFNNKTYNNRAIENDTYLTLLVVIEEGNGNNWWSTLYPNFLPDSGQIEYKSWFYEKWR